MINKFGGKYRFLSNFWPCDVLYDGVWFPSTEHAYQAAKTLDPHLREAIKNLDTPGKTKRAGKNLIIRTNWDVIRINVMMELVLFKFAYHNNLKLKLLATAPEELIEGNTWNDTCWGVCNGKGENMLGKTLMRVRSLLTN